MVSLDAMHAVRDLPAACTDVLETAAVIGTGFDLDVLAAAGDWDPLECLDVLGELGRVGLVEPEAGPDRHRFVDASVHAAVLEQLPPSRRVRLHARVAEAIGSLHADQLDAHLLAVVFQVDFVPGREAQQEAELDFLTGLMKSTPGFVHGTWVGDDAQGLSCIVFDSEDSARAVAANAAVPPDASIALRSVDVYSVARDI